VAGRGAGGGPATGTGGARPDGGVSDGAPDGATDGGTGYMPCPTTSGTACAVLPLGDSITEGCCTAPEGGYRIELFRLAVTNAKNLTFVGTLTNGPTSVANKTFPSHHEGHGGYTIAGGGQGALAGTITDKAISSTHPNIVLLMIGTNDINGNVDVANAPKKLGQLIDEIITDAPDALVVVATIIPISAPGGDKGAQTFNAAIPALVSARASAGKHVILVDNYAAFSKDQSYQTTLKADGLHPNTAGYVVLGQSFYNAIGGLLPAAP
jgi:lysophospholipase L1-like esterase